MRASILATAFAAILMSSAATAQPSDQPMMWRQMPGNMMGPGMGHMMQYGMMPMMGMMNPAQHIEGRLAFLETELQITQAQAPQWNSYADALRANAKRMKELMDQMISSGMMGPGMRLGQRGMRIQGQPGAAMSLPDRFKRMERHISVRMEILQAMKGPTTELYAVLSDEQKRMADLLLSPMGMMGMM